MRPSFPQPDNGLAQRARTPVSPAWRLCLAALAPLALAGCSLSIPVLTSHDSPTARPSPGAPGPTWFYYLHGSAVPSTSAAAAKPAPSTPPPVPAIPVAPAPTVKPCLNSVIAGRMQTPEVTAGPGSVVVRWRGVGDGTVVSYRVTAVPQRLVWGQQPPLSWQTVTAAVGCQPITTTVTGLDRDATYVIWVTAVSKDRAGNTEEPMIGRSEALVTR